MTGKIFCCRYAGRTEGWRYESWREEFGRKWVTADFSSLTDDYVVSELRSSRHSFVALGSMRGTPLRMERRGDVVEHERGDWFLILASGCRMRAFQRGRSVELSGGDLTLLSGDGPASLTQLTEGSRWSIRIPQRPLTDLCRSVEDRVARPIASSGLTRLLLQQVETAHRFGPEIDPAADHATGQYVLDLVVLCLGAQADAAHIAASRGLASARLGSLKAEILRSLSTPDLRLVQIAANQRVSARYVQYLFDQSGTSFTRFVLEHRLLLAHRLLRDPSNRSRKISDIAVAAGFSDISYFNRAFKARFGATPTDDRAKEVR
jgi:AraC-like DNA-binding protein